MNVAELKKMSKEDVKQVASDLGVEFHHKSGKDKIIDKIEAALEGKADEEIEDEDGAEGADADGEGEFNPEFLKETAPMVEAPKRANKAVLQRKEDDRDDSNLPPTPTAVQKHVPHASVSKELATVAAAKKALEPLLKRGLEIVSMTEKHWHLKNGRKEASGNMHMPLSTLFHEANLLLQATKLAREDGSSPR